MLLVISIDMNSMIVSPAKYQPLIPACAAKLYAKTQMNWTAYLPAVSAKVLTKAGQFVSRYKGCNARPPSTFR
jgi:hypothetical protein